MNVESKTEKKTTNQLSMQIPAYRHSLQIQAHTEPRTL